MLCPACTRPLVEHTVGKLVVDICENGCRGIWFDRFELQKVDEDHEALGELVLRAADGESTAPAKEQRYSCPRCKMIMMRHLFRPGIRVEVDTCPKCAGVWLDHGELGSIRGAQGTDAQRRAAASKYVEEMFKQIRNN